MTTLITNVQKNELFVVKYAYYRIRFVQKAGFRFLTFQCPPQYSFMPPIGLCKLLNFNNLLHFLGYCLTKMQLMTTKLTISFCKIFDLSF